MKRNLPIAKVQIKIIKIAQKDLGIDDDTYRALLWERFRKRSCTELTAPQAARLIDEFVQKGFELKEKPSRPRGYKTGRPSRDAQMRKIEALLTVGKKPWAYADTLAKNICKVDRLAWVKDDQLYKIITALRKQAQRDNWDLTGEKS